MYIQEDFSKHLCLNNCYIKGVFNYSNNKSIKSKNLLLEFSTFENQVILQKKSFNELLLQSSIFLSFVNFTDVKIKEPLDLTSISFKEFANFLGIQCSVKNRETARIIKNSFEQQKNIIEANKFYVLEMQKMEEKLKFNENPLDWIVFKIHKISSNHSQDWMLVLFWILSLTFLYSGFKQKYYSGCSGGNQLMLYSLLSISSIIVFIESIVLMESKKINKFIVFLIFNIINYACYGIVTNDYQLLCVSKIFYQFSQISENSHFPLSVLIYKVSIAYLIYQLIVSIRQNTRRK
ncbi:hypothetical protein [Sulfurimonas hydrogeniphila]|uniref:hypothetical protein n=1 Tax=Sulfurimonas hydrogeniphila TaxID=2509341 RepID=UPI00125EE94A|nr:hypothetical protein [Sulfurimonas hydrogeniphila]